MLIYPILFHIISIYPPDIVPQIFLLKIIIYSWFTYCKWWFSIVYYNTIMVATQLLTLPSSVCSDQPSNPTSEGSFSADRKTGFLKGHVFTKRDVPLSINQYEGMRVNPSIGIQFFFLILVWLVVWNIFSFPYIGNNHPNWLIFFRGVGIPPTSVYIPITPKRNQTWQLEILRRWCLNGTIIYKWAFFHCHVC